MDFEDAIKQFSARVSKIKDDIQTEEATKTSIIMPLFATLGYDIFNPEEFVPEFTADIGIKKGEKVDYAIMKDGNPIILVEAKKCGSNLDKHGSQLIRYYSTTTAKFAILTDGIIYKFFTDLEQENLMDATPFLTIDLLHLKENHISELKRFCKESFNEESILNTASELKYTNEFKSILSSELQEPSENFIRFFLSNTYSGSKTQNVIERFRPVLKKALNSFINELMNDKIQTALRKENEDEISEEPIQEKENTEARSNTIITTEEELEAYFIIKNILKEFVPMKDITYRDTIHYINILYKDNGRKWICRLKLNNKSKILMLPNEDKNYIKYSLKDIYELELYKDQLIDILQRYVDIKPLVH